MWKWLMVSLGKTAYAGEGNKLVLQRLIQLFHTSLTPTTRGFIIDDFKRPDTQMRIVLSTVSFGLGIDIRDIRLVIHWGLPKDGLTYWQEVCMKVWHK